MAYKKGFSGNPAGRPKGSTDKRNALRKAFENDSKDVIKKCIELAKQGDPACIRMVLERLVPPIRAKAEVVKFELDADASLTDTAKQILTAIAAGQIAPDTGRMLIDGVASLSRIQEVTDLAARIDYLEANIQ